MTTQWRAALLAAILALCTLVAGGYAFYTLNRATENLGTSTTTSGAASDVLDEPHVVFRHTGNGPSYGKVAVVPLSKPHTARTLTLTSCERVYSVGEAGLCLSAKRGVVTTYKAAILDAQLAPERTVRTAGEPSRVRLSADGRLAATTSFTTGHSYLSSSFSTRTVIYDVKTGKLLHNLEKFSIVKDGKPYSNVDVNVWGVTFKRQGSGFSGFYATMATQNVNYLVEGNMRTRTLRTIKRDVECPSLSPDGTRIAYKKRDNSEGFFGWRVHIFDLRSGADFVLPGERSVDDQVEWLDNKNVLYGLVRQVGYVETDIWKVPANGGGKPSVFIREAWSPAVVRTPAD